MLQTIIVGFLIKVALFLNNSSVAEMEREGVVASRHVDDPSCSQCEVDGMPSDAKHSNAEIALEVDLDKREDRLEMAENREKNFAPEIVKVR